MLKELIGLVALFATTTAVAVPAQYTFSVNNLAEERQVDEIDPVTGEPSSYLVDATPEQQMFSNITTISGTFWYDSEAEGITGITATTPPSSSCSFVAPAEGATCYLGNDVFTNIEGRIGGNSFGVTGGYVFFVDEGVSETAPPRHSG